MATEPKKPCGCVGGCAESVAMGHGRMPGLPPGQFCQLTRDEHKPVIRAALTPEDTLMALEPYLTAWGNTPRGTGRNPKGGRENVLALLQFLAKDQRQAPLLELGIEIVEEQERILVKVIRHHRVKNRCIQLEFV